MSWTVIFLLGGGFAMAAGVMDSGLANYVGAQLEFVSELSPLMIVLICAGTVSFVTQLAANTATITIFLPIIQTIALKAKINPLYSWFLIKTRFFRHHFFDNSNLFPKELIHDFVKTSCLFNGNGDDYSLKITFEIL